MALAVDGTSTYGAESQYCSTIGQYRELAGMGVTRTVFGAPPLLNGFHCERMDAIGGVPSTGQRMTFVEIF